MHSHYDVDRGEIVTVEVQSGGAVLRIDAEAQASGRQGQSITLRNSTSGKIFRAKITGKGRVLLECRSGRNLKMKINVLFSIALLLTGAVTSAGG